MTAFDEAMAELHADPDLSEAIRYRRPPATWLAGDRRGIRSTPPRLGDGLEGAVTRSETVRLDVLASTLPWSPRAGDIVEMAGATWLVEDEPIRDARGLSWRLPMAEQSGFSLYRRGQGDWAEVSVVLRFGEDDAGGLAAIGTKAAGVSAKVAAAQLPDGEARRGDELLVDGVRYTVAQARQNDRRTVWDIDLAEVLTAAAPDVGVGAIRYDAWDAPASALTQAEQAALSQADYTFRAPFWATVAGSAVTLPAADQARMDAEIQAAAGAGLHFWAFLGWDPSDTANAALNLYRSSTIRGMIGFCMIENMQGLYYGGDYLPNVARTVALMAEPGYRKVFGTRPLLFINAMSDADIVDRFGSLAAIATVLQGIRDQCTAAGVGDPYIVMMDGWHVRAASLAGYGADACSAYAALGTGITGPTAWAGLGAAADQWRIDAAALGVPVVAPLTVGWDVRPRIGGDPTWFGGEASADPTLYWQQATAAEIAQHVADGIAWLRANEALAPAQTALIYAWNEFTEGGWLCPTYSASAATGDRSRVDALAAVLAP